MAIIFTPVWQAASPTYGSNAGHINQFFGLHASQLIYSGGALQDKQATGAALYQASYTSWFSQSFTTTTNQTTISSVQLQMSTVGGSPTLPLINAVMISIYADQGGTPTGSPLVSNVLSNNYVYSSPFWVTVPLPLINLTPLTEYHIVIQQVGSSSHYYALQQSNRIGGAATSSNGTSWTNQNYGLMYQIFDGTGVGKLQFIYEDGGARWVQFSYNSQNMPTQITEYTTAQSPTGYLQATRTLNYTTGILTGVS